MSESMKDALAAECLRRGDEIAMLRAALADSPCHADMDAARFEINSLRAEVAALRKERDEARGNAERYAADILRVMAQRDEAQSRILSAEMDRDVAYAKLEGTWPHPQIDKLTRDWEAMNAAADRFCGDWKRAESRLSALAAAARTYRYSERKYGGGLRPEFAPKVAESGAALDSLLSGEEGR